MKMHQQLFYNCLNICGESKTRQVAIFQADTAGKFSDSDKLWWKDKG